MEASALLACGGTLASRPISLGLLKPGHKTAAVHLDQRWAVAGP
jgi:hypothetical protein